MLKKGRGRGGRGFNPCAHAHKHIHIPLNAFYSGYTLHTYTTAIHTLSHTCTHIPASNTHNIIDKYSIIMVQICCLNTVWGLQSYAVEMQNVCVYKFNFHLV